MYNDELLDLVNSNDEVIGTIKRSLTRNDPTKIFRVVSITIFNNRGETLIQKRSVNKSHPGLWENAASGHVPAGESPSETAKREIFEELGITGDPIYFDKWFISHATKSKFMWMYYLLVPAGMGLKINKYEVAEVKWIKPDDLIEFAKTELWDVGGVSHKEIMAIKKYLGL